MADKENNSVIICFTQAAGDGYLREYGPSARLDSARELVIEPKGLYFIEAGAPGEAPRRTRILAVHTSATFYRIVNGEPRDDTYDCATRLVTALRLKTPRGEGERRLMQDFSRVRETGATVAIVGPIRNHPGRYIADGETTLSGDLWQLFLEDGRKIELTRPPGDGTGNLVDTMTVSIKGEGMHMLMEVGLNNDRIVTTQQHIL